MTDLNKLLYVANKVWPDGEWAIYGNKIAGFISYQEAQYTAVELQPHLETMGGKAQLMDIVFSLMRMDDIDGFGLSCLYNEDCPDNVSYSCWCRLDTHRNDTILVKARGISEAEAIINLAAEVL